MLIDMNLRFPLLESLSAELTVSNLLDTKHYQANAGLDGIPRPGRNIHLTLKAAF